MNDIVDEDYKIVIIIKNNKHNPKNLEKINIYYQTYNIHQLFTNLNNKYLYNNCILY